MIVASIRAWQLTTYYLYCSGVSILTGVADFFQLTDYRQRMEMIKDDSFEIFDA